MHIDELEKIIFCEYAGGFSTFKFAWRASRGSFDILHIKCIHSLFLGNYMPERWG